MMHSAFIPSQKTQLIPGKPLIRWCFIGILFITALGIRLYHLDKPPLDFHPLRQYYSAHIARGLYYETIDSLPDWKRRIASKNMQSKRTLEPRIMEHIASFAYRIAGGEHLWIPRLLSSIFWLIGGAFLYLIAQKTASSGAALFSTVFYLFLPFGISGSRSFLAEPMMIMMLLFGILTILYYYERPSVFRLLIAAAVSALAIFIKPMCLFLIFGVFIAFAIYRDGIRKTIISKKLLIFAVVSLLPVIAYFFLSGFFQEGIQEQSRISFNPYLLLDSSFWKDWLKMTGRVVGYIALTGAILGILLFRQGIPRVLITGLWIGYFIFGLAFNNRITTHGYYQLQLIPVVAISIGPMGALAISHLTDKIYSRWRIAVAAIILSVVLSIGIISMYKVQWRSVTPDLERRLEILGSIFGVNPQFIKFVNPDSEKEVRIAQEIGEIVGHGTTVVIASDYGQPLSYYGELAVENWPSSTALQKYMLRAGVRTVEEFFNNRYIRWGFPEYFIVTDFREFNKQTDLKNFLYENFPVIVRNNNYLIYDLRKKAEEYK